MYYAKAAGKARHEVFNKKMHDEAMSRLKRHSDLKRAVEHNEFHVFYQPIISLRSGRLTGFEVLARWDHPDHGAVDPVDFISHAEDTGLIVKLGRWVLDQACRQLRAWRDQGLADDALTMSVNVSKRQVAHPEFVDDVQQILRDHGVDGSRLALEITESVIMENPDSITEVLGQLKDLEVEIHMDDFGTGYSSLSYLHRFPLDMLKIDRAFVSTMSDNNDYADIIHTVVALAHTLNMRVIVEGVETEEQLVRLMALNGDFAQGFYFSMPLDAVRAAEILEARRQWLKPAA
jgi:EAL domain-containing protein (putative c-di-GMP-specific phosphodiesterase class I)